MGIGGFETEDMIDWEEAAASERGDDEGTVHSNLIRPELTSYSHFVGIPATLAG